MVTQMMQLLMSTQLETTEEKLKMKNAKTMILRTISTIKETIISQAMK